MIFFFLRLQKAKRRLVSRDHGGSSAPFIHLGRLLGHFHQGLELVLNAWQSNLLKQALLSLSEHHANQHTEHGWTHVVAGSVGERLLQVVQGSWGRKRGQHTLKKHSLSRKHISNHCTAVSVN